MPAKYPLRFFVAAKPRQLSIRRPVGESVDEGRVVLLASRVVWHQDRDLFAGLPRRRRRRAGRPRLAEADVAANDPIHGLVGFEVAEHLFDSRRPGRPSPRRESRLERRGFAVAGQHLRALPCGAPRIQIEEFRRDIAYALRGLAARFLPIARRRACWSGAVSAGAPV